VFTQSIELVTRADVTMATAYVTRTGH